VVERRTQPVVIDADGLNCLGAVAFDSDWFGTVSSGSHSHPGEMLRLLGADNKSSLIDRVSAAREFATTHKLILVLKGSRPLVAAPDGRVFVNPTGNPGLGTAGSGDTLTGLIAGFLSQAFGSLKRDANALEATLAALVRRRIGW
jgi:NAD(P)H-hydrate epimerase